MKLTNEEIAAARELCEKERAAYADYVRTLNSGADASHIFDEWWTLDNARRIQASILFPQLLDAVEELQAENARLREAMAEAAECIADWGLYASEYFQEKHGLEDDVQRFRALAEPAPCGEPAAEGVEDE